jgi:TonB dependent receptor
VGLNNVQVERANYAAKPWDGAFYIQDKIEYDFLTVTLGGRFEYARADGIFFNDPLDPTNGTTQRTVCENPTTFGFAANAFQYTAAGDTVTYRGLAACQRDTSLFRQANEAAFRDDMGNAPTRTAFSPRVGFAFPITETSNAFFNFGIYVQNPLYNNLYQGTGIGTPVEGTPAGPQFRLNSYVGNPRLESERTTAYEIGYGGQFARNWALQAVAFSKDQSGLSGVRQGGQLRGTENPVVDPGTLYGPSLNYTVIVNQDFQTVRGFQFVLRRGLANYWGADLNYGYMQVKTNASPPDLEFQRTTEEGDIPPRQEIRSDADQRHTLSAVLRLGVDERTPTFRFGNLLRNSGLTVTGRVISGFPYTPTFTFTGGASDRLLRNSGTGPTAFFVNAEARKSWNVSNLRYQTFVRVSNLFDQKNCAQVFATTGNCNGGASPQARLAAGNFTGEGELSTFFDRPQYLYDRRFVNAGVRVDF